jgi:hypothetical protein
MEDNWQSKLEASVGQLAEQIKSALNLDIYTFGRDINKADDAPDKNRALAETHLVPTGDIKQYLPAQFKEDTVTVNQDLYAVHVQAVEQAIQARKEMLNYVKDLIKEMKEILS